MNKHESLGAVHTHTHTQYIYGKGKQEQETNAMVESVYSTERATIYSTWALIIQICANKLIQWKKVEDFQRNKNRLNKAYTKISFIKCIQNYSKKIGYDEKEKKSVKRIKLLHNSLSFL